MYIYLFIPFFYSICKGLYFINFTKIFYHFISKISVFKIYSGYFKKNFIAFYPFTRQLHLPVSFTKLQKIFSSFIRNDTFICQRDIFICLYHIYKINDSVKIALITLLFPAYKIFMIQYKYK